MRGVAIVVGIACPFSLARQNRLLQKVRPTAPSFTNNLEVSLSTNHHHDHRGSI